MNTFDASIFTEDVIKFALGIVILTIVTFIIWFLLRELRLWYWKINNLLKILKHIDKRIREVEFKIEWLTQEITSISQNTVKLSELIDDALIKNKHQDISPEEIDNEEIIASKIKE